jgi:hypothetical protein
MRLSPLPLVITTLASAASVRAQTAPGAELWRVAAVTLALPPALTVGATASTWNPAQPLAGAGWFGLELIQTPAGVGAAGLLATVRVPLRPVGNVGLVYGRMGVSDLVRTTDTPDPTGPGIPFYDQELSLVWATTLHGLTGGARLRYHDTRFDGATINGWGLDFGLVQQVGERLRLAASTRGFKRLASDPEQDLFAGVEYRLWRGALWRGVPGSVRVRYGLSGGHPGNVDHQVGAGLEVSAALSVDALLAREASYGHVAWRGAAGLRVAVGRYRLTFARDGGVSEVGSAFRVGLEARLR